MWESVWCTFVAAPIRLQRVAGDPRRAVVLGSLPEDELPLMMIMAMPTTAWGQNELAAQGQQRVTWGGGGGRGAYRER
jgi:hypothetical protein